VPPSYFGDLTPLSREAINARSPAVRNDGGEHEAEGTAMSNLQAWQSMDPRPTGWVIGTYDTYLEAQRAVDSLPIDIDPDDNGSARPQQLSRELAQEAQSEHDHGLAERRRAAANPVQRDCAEGRERALLERQAIGKSREQIPRDEVDGGGVGISRSAARDPIANP